MLSDPIVISVDTANDGNLSSLTLIRTDKVGNRSDYITPSHSLVNRDVLSFYRSYPKKNGNFNGMAKTSVKFTRDLSVPGVDSTTSVTAPIIIEASFSIPVGATELNVREIRQRLVALLDSDTVMDDLNMRLSI